eukprot:CAMPEP_0170593236 /NCGR_PEP_ID=MMETSP0224-20130122/13340_1 /TAXON_ID=285029 /ORGANISM="Togula jolla, Strain CCCM 725" /LENGTH=639 /DNA_ID=CAMNT_0010917175 /DNA_START=95 /DNA_END=2014 /DNA_ORIENTATION=-
MTMLSLVSFLLLAVGSASTAASGDCPSLMLLQVNAEKLEKVRRQRAPDSSLPSVKTLLGDSNGVADGLSDEVGRLEEKLRAFQEEHKASLANKRAEYERNLTALQRQIRKTETTNAAITNETDHMKHYNQALLQHARDLSSDNDALRADLGALRLNLSSAVEFVERALDGANDTEAEELRVIRDLEARHEANSANREHQKRLEEIASATGVSLLHLANLGDATTEEDPQSMVETVGSSFTALVENQKEIESSLEKLFLERYDEGSQQMAELLQLQGRLNHTLSTVTELHADLEQAVEHLDEVHVTLVNQATQLRSFSESLSRRELPVEASDKMLLQMNAEKLEEVQSQGIPDSEESKSVISPLPTVRTLIGDSKSVAHGLSKEVDQLEDRLKAVQEAHAASLAKKRAAYEHNLTAMQRQITTTAATNTAISNHTAEVKRSNVALLSHARELSEQNDALRADLDSLKLNLSTAMEFADKALDGSNDTEARELEVIRNLEDRHAIQSANKEHRERLDEIEAAMDVSLLHFGNAGDEDGEAQSVVESLGSSFGALEQEQHATEKALHEIFLKHYDEMAASLAELLETQEKLKSTRATVTALHVDLEEAVAHLEEVHESLEGQAKKLRGFAESMSQKQLPADD